MGDGSESQQNKENNKKAIRNLGRKWNAAYLWLPRKSSLYLASDSPRPKGKEGSLGNKKEKVAVPNLLWVLYVLLTYFAWILFYWDNAISYTYGLWTNASFNLYSLEDNW